MKTRITELFGIEVPILLSGMSWISVPKMVAAVSNAGGLGILATGPLNAERTRAAIREIRSLTDKPFGCNATLLFPGAAENAKVMLEEQVPVINFALGKGDWIVKAAHGYGGKVIATVVHARHGKRAEEYGVDALIATGHEAAAHGEAVTSLVLVPSLVDAVRIPVVAAGGFADGRGLAAALALGAEGIAMGTRFMTTKESPLHDNFKRLSIEKGVEDTLASPRIDGIPCRVLKSQPAERAVRRGLDPVAAFRNSREIATLMKIPYWKLCLGVLASGWKNARQLAYMANAFQAFRLATEEGDLAQGILPVGQATGLLHDEPTVKEAIDRIVAEAIGSRERLDEKLL
ncbi:MAG: nitronate monooxygenase [Deltaproteobacteria bacterium]|nr:nitronate monooxygenase [Deltaproteobacteria bacterium]